MRKNDLNYWIMYHEIHHLERLGFSNSRIGRYLSLDARTVKKYLQMSEVGFDQFLLGCQYRSKLLSSFESFVREKLDQFPETSSAQIHDWLREHYSDLPHVTPRTVYSFVMFVRHKYNIPITTLSREYFPVEQLVYGEQAQVDFGQYNMRFDYGKRKKVWFFTMVLSRSRMKYVWFSAKTFTSLSVSQAHEKAFAFFDGIPKIIVYDQDRTMVVDENMGDIILTSTFKQYTKSRSFQLHFCRKADPQSKGKVENVIQYVKKNFLYNRLYLDIKTLNTEALEWLSRTANHLPHNYTKKSPQSEYIIEKEYLKTYTPLAIENKEVKIHYVRKTNVIAYKSNFYTVPMGTYKGSDSRVIIKENKGVLEIYDLQNTIICHHVICSDKGQTISNTHHKRDTSAKLNDMMDQVADCFTDREMALDYLKKIKNKLPRYTRDHLQVILKALKDVEKPRADEALEFCLKNSNLSGFEFEQVLQVCFYNARVMKTKKEVKLLDPNNIKKANETPQTSNIDDYQNIINP